MKKQLKYFSPIIILYAFTAYTIATVLVTDISFTFKHYINFILVAIPTIAYFFKRETGHYLTGIVLLGGSFTKATFFPSYYYFAIGTFKISWPYFLLFLFFIVIHWDSFPDWFRDTETKDTEGGLQKP